MPQTEKLRFRYDHRRRFWRWSTGHPLRFCNICTGPHIRTKIGVELDGKAFHDRDRDTVRDHKLWRRGWRIFRITGSEAVKWLYPPTEPDFADSAERGSQEYNDDLSQFAELTGDGVFWSLNVVFYKPERFNCSEHSTARWSLETHRLVDFPIHDSREQDDDD